MKYEHILKFWGIKPNNDISDVHPEFFCNSCYSASKRQMSSSSSPSVVDSFEWLPHDEECCLVCDTLCKGGRPKKRKYSKGRPTNIHQHIRAIACEVPQFSLPQINDDRIKESVTCCSCSSAANKPVELLPCKSIACSKCSLDLAKSATFICPGCSLEHPSTEDTFTKLSSIAERMFADLTVTCEHCQCRIKLENLDEECSEHMESHQASLEDVLAVQNDRAPTELEKKVALTVVSKMVKQNETATIKLSTKGRPISLMKVTQSRVPSGEAVTLTRRRRSNELAAIRTMLSVDDDEKQIVDEMKVIPAEMRKEIVKELDFTINVPAEQCLAMKSEL